MTAATADQDRARRSVAAHSTLDRAAADIAVRLATATAQATPAATSDPSRPRTHRGGAAPADPVYAQVAQLEAHLRKRGGPLHRCSIVLANLDQLAEAIDAGHRMPAELGPQVANLQPSIRHGPVGARLHTVPRLAVQIGTQMQALNDAIYGTWRDMWRGGDDRDATVLDQALLAYSGAASYAASIARGLLPYEPAAAGERPPDERCGRCGFRPIKYKRRRLCNTCSVADYRARQRAENRTVRRFAG